MLDFPAAKRRVAKVIEALERVVQDDPEQEVRGMAITVLDATIIEIKKATPDDRVIRTTEESIAPEAIARAELMRAADAFLVAKQLDAALGDSPIVP